MRGGVGDHPQLEPCEILWLLDGPSAVGDVAKAVLPVPQADETLGGQPLEQRGASRPVKQRFGLRRRGDKEGEVQQAEFLE